MKLQNGRENIDTDKDDKQQKKSKQKQFKAEWAVRMVEAANYDIPIVAKVTRGSARKQVTFDTYAAAVENTQCMNDNFPHLFRSRREADRASHYIGQAILNEILKVQNPDYKKVQSGKFFECIMKSLECINVDAGLLSTFVDSIFKAKDAFEKGILGPEEYNKTLEHLVEILPDNLRILAQGKITMMRSGSNLTDLYEHIGWGGNRR